MFYVTLSFEKIYSQNIIRHKMQLLHGLSFVSLNSVFFVVFSFSVLKKKMKK